jgi:hypothetical protein
MQIKLVGERRFDEGLHIKDVERLGMENSV